MYRALPLLLLLVGCPDPAATDPAAMGQPGQPNDPGQAGQPGQPNDPNAQPAGQPNDPNAGGGAPGNGPPAGSRPAPTGFNVKPGEGVKVSGTVTYKGEAKGTLRVDFLRNPEGSPYPELMHSIELSGPGAWEAEVPKGFGALMVVGFIDADNNGPSPGEPMAANKDPVNVADQAISGLELALSENPDMGGKGPTPPGEGGVPADGQPAQPPGDPAGKPLPPGGVAPAGAPGGAPADAAPAGGEAGKAEEKADSKAGKAEGKAGKADSKAGSKTGDK